MAAPDGDVEAQKPVLAAGDSGDKAHSGFGQELKNTQGTLPVDFRTEPSQLNSNPVDAKSELSAKSSTILRGVMEAAEQMRSDGRSHVEVQLHLRDGQTVTVQLRFQAGEIRPTFRVDSPELRLALEQSWKTFANTRNDREIRFAPPVFSGGQNFPGDSGHSNGRQRQPFEPEPTSFEEPLISPKNSRVTQPAKSEPLPGPGPEMLRLFA